ncbi:MAG: prepilin-type N-terminal cleavage/methylation domain-containing protein [Opitutales bacterium]|nr:prepilin-type N-terminal cleavage/methylation domain-containing protein [Opitutales bacterium]
MKFLKQKKGFTLAEILIASAILSFFALGFAQITLLVQRMAFDSQGKIEVTENIRKFTSHISRDARPARVMLVYQGMPSVPADLNTSERLADGQTGDLAVFVHAIPQPINEVNPGEPQQFYLSRVIAYARIPGSEGQGPVVRFERRLIEANTLLVDIDPGETLSIADNQTINQILAEMLIDGQAQRREVVELSRGLANGRLFYFFRDSALVINGEIVQGNRVRRVTNTYNFTVNRQG